MSTTPKHTGKSFRSNNKALPSPPGPQCGCKSVAGVSLGMSVVWFSAVVAGVSAATSVSWLSMLWEAHRERGGGKSQGYSAGTHVKNMGMMELGLSHGILQSSTEPCRQKSSYPGVAWILSSSALICAINSGRSTLPPACRPHITAFTTCARTTRQRIENAAKSHAVRTAPGGMRLRCAPGGDEAD
jgi:hypothetical protein